MRPGAKTQKLKDPAALSAPGLLSGRLAPPSPIRSSAAILLVALVLTAVPAAGQVRPDGAPPVNLTADEVVHNRDLGVVTASGNVEIIQGPRSLYADSITYNERQDQISASGNVRLHEPNGDVIFADYVDLSGDMREGTLKSLRLLLTDRSRIVASEGRRSDGTRLDLDRAVYSPCESCKTNPSRPLLWQVKAVRVIHDSDRQTVEYKDAWLEMFGVPVAYTPYFSHPDPTVKRRTGFLPPSIGSSNYFGSTLQTPYFWDIAPNHDLTFTPLLTSLQGVGLGAEHRFIGQKSEIKGKFSGAVNDNGELRGHVDMKSRFNLNDTWRWGVDAQRSTDDTYTRQYRYNTPPTLTSRLYTEGFRGRNYMAANGYAFQGLRDTDKPGQAPLILPSLDYSHVGEPRAGGGRTRMDANLLAFTRDQGTDVRRLSVAPGWDLPYVGPAGDVYKLSATLRGDLYHVDDHVISGRRAPYSGTAGRVYPEAALEWRYPFVRRHEGVSELFEPITSLVVSPYGGNLVKIPNEDSREVEFDETNLFTGRRFAGIDRVETGPRFNYGLRWSVFGDQGGSTSVLFGQSVRARDDSTFARGTGLEDHFSDFVGRVNIRPMKNLSLDYRTRLDKDNFQPLRNEVSATVGPKALTVGFNYLFSEKVSDSSIPTLEQLSLNAASQLSRNWRVSFASLQDIEANALRALLLNATYEDECFIIAADVRRSFFYDRGLKTDDSIILRLTFKTLGEIGSSMF
ncbi:MAG: LPS-assembly protein LptD [Rhodospirillales bacterium]|nr:LPS-assembly protein LptD [Rhodospirillales bacterium]